MEPGHERHHTATGFPRVFYLHYHGYATVLSAMGAGALSEHEGRERGTSRARNVNATAHFRPVIAVTGLAFEARIAAGAGVSVVCGGDRPTLERLLNDAANQRHQRHHKLRHRRRRLPGTAFPAVG